MIRTLAVAALVFSPRIIWAQVVPPLPIDSVARGTEVRVWSKTPPLDGWKLQYLGRTDTTVVLAERSGSVRIADFHNEMSFASLEKMEVRTGKKLDVDRIIVNTAKGTGIGLLAGIVLGGALLAADSQSEGSFYGAVAVAEVGPIVGALVGAMTGFSGSGSWRPVQILRR